MVFLHQIGNRIVLSRFFGLEGLHDDTCDAHAAVERAEQILVDEVDALSFINIIMIIGLHL